MAKQANRSQSLGERIREMRKKLNIGLNQLAERIGCPPEYLHEIEEGKISPPVGALIQISRALAVDSASLLAEDRKAERRKSYRKRTSAYSYRSLTPEAEDKHIWAYLVTLDPEKPHEMVAYKHLGEEFVYVIDGKVEFQVGEDMHVLKKADSLHFDSARPHKLRNLSKKQTSLLVVVYTP